MESEDTRTKKKTAPLWKKLVWALLILILSFALLLIAFNLYLGSQTQKVYERIEALNDGSLSFRSCSISLFRDFPKATLHLKDVMLSDSTFSPDRPNFLEAGDLEVALSLLQWKRGIIEISALRGGFGPYPHRCTGQEQPRAALETKSQGRWAFQGSRG